MVKLSDASSSSPASRSPLTGHLVAIAQALDLALHPTIESNEKDETERSSIDSLRTVKKLSDNL
jgi:hypothetical protein